MAFLPIKGQKKQLDSVTETRNGFPWFCVMLRSCYADPRVELTRLACPLVRFTTEPWQGQKEEWALSPILMNTKVPVAPPQTVLSS